MKTRYHHRIQTDVHEEGSTNNDKQEAVGVVSKQNVRMRTTDQRNDR